MTRGTLKKLMAQHVPTSAWFWPITDFVQINETIDRRVESFKRESLCSYDGEVALTLALNDEVISLVGAKLAKRVVRPVYAWLPSSPLCDLDGRPGLIGLSDLRRIDPNFETATASKPRYCIWESEESIRLYPKADGAYSGHVAGWLGHTPLGAGADYTASLAADETVNGIDVPSSLEETLAMWCVVGVVPFGAAPDLVRALTAGAEERMATVRHQAVMRHMGPVVQGGTGRRVGF